MQGSLTTNSSGTSSGEVGEVPVGWTFVLFFLAIVLVTSTCCWWFSKFGQVIQPISDFGFIYENEVRDMGMFCELLHD
jgi:hypothetical protein